MLIQFKCPDCGEVFTGEALKGQQEWCCFCTKTGRRVVCERALKYRRSDATS